MHTQRLNLHSRSNMAHDEISYVAPTLHIKVMSSVGHQDMWLHCQHVNVVSVIAK